MVIFICFVLMLCDLYAIVETNQYIYSVMG